MAAKADVAGGTGDVALPMLSVARFQETTRLIERLAREKQSVFIEAMQQYRTAHRDGTSRPLKPEEAAAVAAALAASLQEDPVELAARVQDSGLTAYDEPQPLEILLAGGLATAPEAVDVALQFVALIEMPVDEFDEAHAAGTLDDAMKAALVELGKLDLGDARARAAAALQHLADRAGVSSGEALGLPLRTVWQALTQAARTIPTSGLSSLTGSLEPTDGPASTSSTESP